MTNDDPKALPSNKMPSRIKYILAKPKDLGAFASRAKATAGHFIIWRSPTSTRRTMARLEHLYRLNLTDCEISLH